MHSDHFGAQVHPCHVLAEEAFGTLSVDLRHGLCKWILSMARKTGPIASLTQLESAEVCRVNSARRFAAYTMLAAALQQRGERTPAPQVFVKLVNSAFEASKVGFSQKRART